MLVTKAILPRFGEFSIRISFFSEFQNGCSHLSIRGFNRKEEVNFGFRISPTFLIEKNYLRTHGKTAWVLLLIDFYLEKNRWISIGKKMGGFLWEPKKLRNLEKVPNFEPDFEPKKGRDVPHRTRD